MDAADVDTVVDLRHLGSIWGTVAGCAHRQEGKAADILKRLTPELTAALKARSAGFVTQLGADFESFMADERTTAHVARADAALRELGVR